MWTKESMLVVVACFAVSTSADVVYVPPGDGLQNAIEIAKDGDILQLGEGDYYRYDGHDPLGKSITIRGEVDAQGIPLSRFSSPSRSAFSTDPDGSGQSHLTLENLVFENGVGNGVGYYISVSSRVTIRNCFFLDWSGFAGPPVFLRSASQPYLVVLSRCVIGADRDNYTMSNTKAAILNVGADLRLVDCVVEAGRYCGVSGGFRTDPVGRGDVDGNGVVDGGDLLALQGILGTCPGDLDGDGEVTGADLGSLLLLFGSACP